MNMRHEEVIANIIKTVDENNVSIITINEKINGLLELIDSEKARITKLKNTLIILTLITGITLAATIVTIIQMFLI